MANPQYRKNPYGNRSRRRKTSRQINVGQKRFLRKLIDNLESLINEKGHYTADDLRGSESDENADEDEDTKERLAPDSRIPQNALDLGMNEERRYNGPENVIRFTKLCEHHGHLSSQIQNSLDALGGGGRTARALAKMQWELDMTSNSFLGTDDGPKFDPKECVEGLHACQEAVQEVTKSFKELGVFNAIFFDKLEAVSKNLEITTYFLDREYGFSAVGDTCKLDNYPDSFFGSLVESLEAYIYVLTRMAEKEIPTIQQAQNFLSQRYLNLTTIATFLSSVTATTLQITAGTPASTLSTVTNALWFVSLVFSTTSAVYSLLVMTWRQSSVRQPSESLPSPVYAWLRNGPMYALITSLICFSIGLCLLAFSVANQQGGLALAVVPSAFAGFNAYAIFVLAAWFLFEQWKERHRERWRKIRDGVKEHTTDAVKKIRKHGLSASRKVKELGIYITTKMCTAAISRNDRARNDVELGQQAIRSSSQPDFMPTKENEHLSSEQMDAPDEMSLAEPVGTLAVRETKSALGQTSLHSNQSTGDLENLRDIKTSQFEDLLQFSPGCSLLAWAFSDTVTVYNVDDQFEVLASFKIPNLGTAKQIAWGPSNAEEALPAFRRSGGPDFLVRSSKGLSVFEVIYNNKFEETGYVKKVGQLHFAVGSARWVQMNDAGNSAFSCLVGKSLKVFERTCKELESYDLSWMRYITRILDVSFLSSGRIACLSIAEYDGKCETELLVANVMNKVVEGTRTIEDGYNSFSICQASCRVLFYGGDHVADVTDIPLKSCANDGVYIPPGRIIGNFGQQPTRSAAFLGQSDRLLVLFTDDEVSIFSTDSLAYYPIHTITTPTSKAIAQNPVSFAVGADNSRSFPYMFAFGDKDGSVKIWSVQSNEVLDNCWLAEKFEVHDLRGRDLYNQSLTVTTGKFLVIPPLVETE